MRQIGTIADEEAARTFGDYLLTLDITTRLDPSPGGWIVWVHREEKVEQARQELQEFMANPADPKYASSTETAKRLRKEAERLERLHARNTINLRGRLNVRSFDRCPVSYLLICLSIAVAVMTGLGGDDRVARYLYLASFHPTSVARTTIDATGKSVETQVVIPVSSGLEGVRAGQVWRLITPIFLHFGMMHLAFNMFWVYDLGGLIEMRRGPWRLLALVLVSAIISNLAQFEWNLLRDGLSHMHPFGGMSGVVYALFGYVWMKSDYDPGSGFSMRSNTIFIMIAWLVICAMNWLGNIANAAHLAGLCVGVLVGLAPHLWHNPWRR